MALIPENDLVIAAYLGYKAVLKRGDYNKMIYIVHPNGKMPWEYVHIADRDDFEKRCSDFPLDQANDPDHTLMGWKPFRKRTNELISMMLTKGFILQASYCSTEGYIASFGMGLRFPMSHANTYEDTIVLAAADAIKREYLVGSHD